MARKAFARLDVGGRPSRLTPEMQDKMVALVRAGNHVETVAAYCGIGDTTFYKWMKMGKTGVDVDSGKPLTRDRAAVMRKFRETILQARAEAEMRNVAIVQTAGTTNWKASAWWLARVYPQRYGQKRQVEVAVAREMEAGLDRLQRKLPPDVYEAVLQALAGDEVGDGGEDEA